ncbi:hypothetical protein THRCLA_22184 [Thraustotheca clavata]|uniref:Uncharacterized protein n=1 Tax=Thraustotheca clavata TaxID=74557 RepID=A0A1V9ZAJ7_9STRA|nr:hypothetical protein THRCLA_22184 [Thraustotheca clavata]
MSVESDIMSADFYRLPPDLTMPEIANTILMLKGRRTYLQALHKQISNLKTRHKPPTMTQQHQIMNLPDYFMATPWMASGPMLNLPKDLSADIPSSDICQAFESLKRQHAAIHDKRLQLSKKLEQDHANERERRPSDEYNELFEGTAFTNYTMDLTLIVHPTNSLTTEICDIAGIIVALKQQHKDIIRRRAEIEQSVESPSKTTVLSKAALEFARLFVDNRVPEPRG